MIVTQIQVDPLDLLRGPGGSVASAARVATEAIESVRDRGGIEANGLEARVAWTAHVQDSDGVGAQDWDPTTPIPDGTFLLQCLGYSVSIRPEPGSQP